MKWTDDRVEALKGLVDQGFTARQIGNELGVTRNAVIGKVHRGGLVFFRNRGPVKEKRKRQRPTPAAKVAAYRRVPPRTTEFEPECTAAAVTMLDLASHQCRWPVGTDPMLYCGADQVAGFPYCVRHCWLAYQGRPA